MNQGCRLAISLCLVTAFLFVGGLALAQEVTGDCEAEVNGRAPRSLTEENPLKLRRNQRIDVKGKANSGRAEQTETKFYVVIFGARVPIETQEGRGAAWGGKVELPGYLKTLTAGVYRVEADGAGKPSGFKCAANGYIDLKGGPLTIALGIGALLAGVGAAVALGARGTAANAPDKGTIARKTGIEDRRAKVAPDKWRTRAADVAYLAAVVLVFYLAYDKILDFGDSLGLALPAAAAGQRRVWVHGRVIRGFIGGFVLGLGAALILQQLDVWPLDLTQGIVFPLGIAIVSAVRGYVGAAFIVTPPPPEVDAGVREPVGVTPGAAAADAPTAALRRDAEDTTTDAGRTQVIERPKSEDER